MGGTKVARKKAKGARGRQPMRVKKDMEDDQDLELQHQQRDEWVAISAIYDQDVHVISEDPFPEYSVTVRPHSSVGSGEEEPASVDIVIRYVRGYPHRPPKVRVHHNKGLGESDVVQLEEMLVAQAGIIAREGRVMVFNLIEAAQEFLSEHNTSDASLWDQMQGRLASTVEQDPADAELAEAGGGSNGNWRDTVDVGLFDWWGESDPRWGRSLEGNAGGWDLFPSEQAVSSPKTKLKAVDSGPKAPRAPQLLNANLEGEIEETKGTRVGSRAGLLHAVAKIDSKTAKGRDSPRENGEAGSNQQRKGGPHMGRAIGLTGPTMEREAKDHLEGTKAALHGDDAETSEAGSDGEGDMYGGDDKAFIVSKGAVPEGVGRRKENEEDSEGDDYEEDEDYEQEGEGEVEEAEEEEEVEVAARGEGGVSPGASESTSESRSSVSELLHSIRTGANRASTAGKQVTSMLDLRPTAIFASSSDNDEDVEEDDEDSLLGFSRAASSPQEDSTTRALQRNLLLGHLLRLVTSSRGPLPHTLPALVQQLEKLRVMPKWTASLLAQNPQLVDRAFRRVFSHAARDAATVSEPSTRWAITKFWGASPELQGEGDVANAAATSRYLADFEEVSLLGKGGFGHVVLCINKLDGRKYAVKKIRLKDKSPLLNSKILREVATLSRLQHHNIVRYYQAWFETGVGDFVGTLETLDQSTTEELLSQTTGAHETSESPSSAVSGLGNTKFLYIQMEYCPRTLRQDLDGSTGAGADKEQKWRIFRQLCEGLAHIHAQGVIHRDLTPNNIFFDTRGDIKIGDFGLAKFSNLEQLEERKADKLQPEAPHEDKPPVTSASTTGQVGTYYYTAPEIEQGWPHVDEKVDMYSLGIVLFEMWHPFSTGMERVVTLNDLKQKGVLPTPWSTQYPQVAALVRLLVTPLAGGRPSAAAVLRSDLMPPRMEDEALNDILRTIQTAEDTSVYDRVIGTIFDPDRISLLSEQAEREKAKSRREELALWSAASVEPRDRVVATVREVFLRHGAQPTESQAVGFLEQASRARRQGVRAVDESGNLVELRYETRLPLVRWVAATQTTALKRYEISQVFRRGVGRSVPRQYIQGDFDIIGGTRSLADAEAIKVAVEIVAEFPQWEGCEVRLNHRELLNAIWAWAGVPRDSRQPVAQMLATMSGAPPRDPDSTPEWHRIRRQLTQGLRLPEAVVDRLQTIERRLSGEAGEVLARLRGALPRSALTSAALEELAELLAYLRIWGIHKSVTIDSLMTPTEDFYSGTFFQIHLRRSWANGSSGGAGATARGLQLAACIAVGGRYDRLVGHLWPQAAASAAPGAVGLTVGVEKLISASLSERKGGSPADVLVCSKGGGGMLSERMQLVADLWAGGIKAEYVCSVSPSLTEQYEYASEHNIRCLAILTGATLSTASTVKVRHLDSRTEKDVPLAELVQYIAERSLPSSGSMRKHRILGRHSSIN